MLDDIREAFLARDYEINFLTIYMSLEDLFRNPPGGWASIEDGEITYTTLEEQKAQFKAAEDAYEGDDYEKAITLYSKLIDDGFVPTFQKKDEKDVYLHRGTCFMKKSEYNSAIEDFTKVIELAEDFHQDAKDLIRSVGHLYRSMGYMNKGIRSEAISDYQKAVQFYPDIRKPDYEKVLDEMA